MAIFGARQNHAPVRIQPYFGYRSSDRLVLQARALRSGKLQFAGGGRWLAIRTMIAQFASREAPDVEVTFELKRQDGQMLQARARTDSEGFVLFDLPLDPPWDLPTVGAWQAARLRWANCHGDQSTSAYVLTPASGCDLAIISDVDDTIIETGITGGLLALIRNWRRLLAQWPDERLAVPGAGVFYSALGGSAPQSPAGNPLAASIAASNRPFFFVSSSPWNLYAYLVAFKQAKGLPLGPLLLRDWGLNRATLGSAGHGAHKDAAIRHLLDMYPHLRFALIGDDTQGDLPAFAGVAADYPGRIAAIFLRRIATDDLNLAERTAQQTIADAGVPLWMGTTYAAGHGFLQQLGLEDGGDAEHLIDALGDQARRQ